MFNICSVGFSAPEGPSYPQRIISLGPALTRQIYLLGAEDKLVGVTTYCRRPAEAQNKEKVGTVVEVSLEKIVHLQPEIVLATALTDPRTKEKLKGLGIKVVDFPAAGDFSHLCEQFLELGGIVGKEKQAAEIVRQAEMQVDILKQKVRGLPHPKVFIQIGARPLFTATEESFFNDFIEFAGGVNIASGAKSGLYSREKVLEDNPDIIIITTMGIAGEREKEIWRTFETLNAVKNNRIYIVDDYNFCSPTPLSFVGTLEEMIEILHCEDE